MYKKYYSSFLAANPGVQHYAAHSHHYWPDVTRGAALQYWDDSARLTDGKWEYFFEKKIPAAQSLIAANLNLSRPEQIVFAPSTHELVYRLLSVFEPGREIRVLTTDSEFYSFDRQINRLSENKNVHLTKVPTEDFATFEDRFVEAVKASDHDLIFLSQVFFNSGVEVRALERIVSSVRNKKTLIAIDGYHAFMAVPTDLSKIENRVFYIAGSYKYAQGGEGCCFMHVPAGCDLRPEYTGWFAGFAGLTGKGGEVLYPDDGLRFAGSTMDFTALYRLSSVLQMFKQENIRVSDIHGHVQKLQFNFRNGLKSLNHPVLNEKNILRNNFENHGHFYAFETHDAALAKKLHDELKDKKILTDYRGSRLRFGFGLYQEESINWHV